jgi:hypothetical protein
MSETTQIYRGDAGSKNGSNATEYDGIMWDDTHVKVQENPAFWYRTGPYGTERRDLISPLFQRA